MTRALRDLVYFFRYRKWRYRETWCYMPRPCYCWRCNEWGWCTYEPAPYSTARGYLCEECAVENDADVDAAWADYYNMVR